MQATSVNKKLQIESASSKIVASLCPLIAFDIVASIENDSLLRKRLINIGSIRTTMEIIAIIPQEFFINERLEVTVLKASFTDEPTRGTKLLIANLAVFIDMLSTLWVRIFL